MLILGYENPLCFIYLVHRLYYDISCAHPSFFVLCCMDRDALGSRFRAQIRSHETGTAVLDLEGALRDCMSDRITFCISVVTTLIGLGRDDIMGNIM